MPSAKVEDWRPLCDPVLWVSGLLYVAIRIWIHMQGTKVPSFFRNYASDILFIPVALPLLCAFWGWTRLRFWRVPSGGEMFLWWGFWSWQMEWLLPRIWAKGTGDGGDVICYGLGAIVAWWVWRRRL